jgi:hypothetical protein
MSIFLEGPNLKTAVNNLEEGRSTDAKGPPNDDDLPQYQTTCCGTFSKGLACLTATSLVRRQNIP